MKICPVCHEELADNVRFCSFCGHALEEGEPASVPAVNTPPQQMPPQTYYSPATSTAPKKRVSPLPFIGLGLGVLAVILCAMPVLAILLAIVGLVISIIGCRSRNRLYGCAVAGILVALLAFLLAAVVGGISAVGRAAESANESYIQDVSTATLEDAKTANEPEADPADEPEETPVVETAEDVTIEEQVLVDRDGVKITATGMESGLFGPELTLLIENDTDADLTFQVRNASVNGFMADTMISEDVAAGKKANTEITFTTNGLEACGIETFTDMEFSFHVFYSDSWDDYFDSDIVHIETSAYGVYTQTVDDSGTVFYDKGGIKIIGKGLSADDSIFGPGLILYIENSSSEDFTVQVRDTSVNGFMVDTTMSQDVIAGKKAITALTFFSTSLDENGITDIESIETSFHVFDMNTWDTIVDTEPITITF